MTMLRRAAGALMETRSSPEWGSSTPPPPGALTGSGGFVNETTPLTIVAAMACMSVLADAISTLPLDQYRTNRDGKLEKIDPSLVVSDPYAEITQQDWITQEMMSLLLSGDGLGQVIDRDRMGYATQIKPQPSRSTVMTRLASGDLETKFNHQKVPQSDVFHMRAISLPGELRGLSPIANLRRTFTMAMAAERYAESFYQNSSVPSGVLEAEAGLSEEDVKLIAQQWREGHQGYAKAAMPAVLSGVKWTQTALDAGDALFLDARKMTVDEMVMLYRVPPHMIGYVDKSTSWGAGIEQQEMGFVRNTLVSWARRFEVALSALLPPGEIVKFDFSHRLRGDTLQRAQAAVLGRNGGWLNIDDVRTGFFDLPPLPDGLGQDYLQPLNFVAIGSPAAAVVAEAGKQPTPPTPPPPSE